MKKTALILLVTILISCGSSENKSSDVNTNDVNSIETVEKEKNWEEFTVGAVGNTMSEMKFDKKNITVQAGSWVRINLVNEGVDPAMLHNIVFVKYGTRKEVAKQSIEAGPDLQFVPKSSDVIAYSDLADPGETVVLEFEAPEKGNYEFICTYPGHSEIMRGYFFVK
ncbi:MAG: hypothetical protein CMD36_05695 [Flavobacteriales bacterium]|nr:hypothetical protein [Flavobacteriales bacterium]|tara:strand:- start:1640 stop:2140 length:501 start_codon:yes stop_codon:yes gene_type:complete